MSPIRHEGDCKLPIESWGSHVDRLIREAQQRGEFDDLPGTGKPLQWEENPFGAEWQSAFRIAKNAGAAPLWVGLDKEIRTDTAALQAMAEQTARDARSPQHVGGPHSLAELEAERQRARTRYLAKAAELDKKIQDFNSHRPRQLSWLEKPRLLPHVAAQQFDQLCPPMS